MTISNLQKQRIIEYLEEGKRFDGRKLDEYRDIKVEIGISKNAEGSCSVKFGETEVWAGVKMEVVTPYPDNQDEGTFMTSAELNPMASESFEAGPPKIDAIELARIIDRGIRESGFIDFKKLCIKEGEKVWQIFLDIYAINDDGNLIDVAGLAGLIALANSKIPVYNEKTEKIEKELTENPIPFKKDLISFNITLHKIGEHVIVDPTKEEEESSEYRISIAVGDNKGEARITSIQKGKEGAITESEIETILNLIQSKWEEMFPKIKEMVFTDGKK